MENQVYTRATPVVVEARDSLAKHAEDLLIARYHAGIADHGFQWPVTGITVEDFRNKEGIVARIAGTVVGRAILDREFYPLAELVNLEVAPAHRGRGVGSAIVRHAIETAARAGFLAIHAQTFKNNVAAHRLYRRHRFLPATQGEMLRVWQFQNLPALDQFHHDHPLAVFESIPSSEPRSHLLRWHDPLSEDELEITLTGGSCQFDSGGVGPAVSALSLRSFEVRLAARVGAIPPLRIGETVAVSVSVANRGSGELTGGFRIGLNTGFRIAEGHPGGEQFSLPPGGNLDRTVIVELTDSFPADLLRISSYQSVPVSVDFLLGDHTFWLAAQAPIERIAQEPGKE
jgi:ribosomal protein S18 acetylase RimI-like enzyme